MDKFFDLKVLNLKNNLLQVVNNSGLPISVVSMAVNELNGALQTKTQMVLKDEMTLYNKNVEKRNKKTQG